MPYVKRYRTRDEITKTVTFVQSTYTVTIPKHTRCRKITEGSTAGSFWVDDLSWIDQKADSLLYHDAVHRGIVLPPDWVEEI